MINSIGTAWKTHLKEDTPPTDRIYSDFRLFEYPDLETGSAAYTLGREDNLIDRAGCESATAPMMFGETVPVLANATWVRSSDFAHTGDNSYKLTRTVGPGSEAWAYLVDSADVADMHGFVAGSSIEFSAWAYIPTASGLQPSENGLQIFISLAGGAFSLVAEANSTALDIYEELSISYDLPSTATGIVIRLYTKSAAADTEYVYYDDIRLTTHNIPGSHSLSSGYIENLLEIPSKFTLQIKFKPNFAFNIGSNQWLWTWYITGSNKLVFFYDAPGDTFRIFWVDAGSSRWLLSAQYDDGSSFRNINQYMTLTAAIDLTTGSTAGSALWMDKTQDDTTWSGNIDAKTTVFNKNQIRAQNGTTGNYDIAYALMIPDLIATDAQVQNDFKDVTNEQIYWDLNGHGTGRTRCNITRFVRTLNTTKSVENIASGTQGANKVSFVLHNLNGEFSDDQYAAFDPTADIFNGTITDKYLQKRSNITVETWFEGDFDTVFFGKLTSGLYKRSAPVTNIGLVSCNADDYISLIARKSVRKGRFYEDADLVDTADEGDSLLHLITRLATKREIFNYLSNSSFENATIGDSWLESGGTWTKDATDSLFGSASGKLVLVGSSEFVMQLVLFTGTKKLNVGETYIFSIWLKSTLAASGANNNIYLQEGDVVGINAATSVAYSLAGGEGYKRADVLHTITDSDSDRFRVLIEADAGDTINVDGAQLIPSDRALNYFVLNNNDGVGSASAADDADSASYDILGFDVQSVAITHPWRRVDSNVSLWSYMKDLGDATIASYIGLTSAGTFRHRSRLATAYEDPIPYGTIDSARTLNTKIDIRNANAVIVHGVNIIKQSNLQIMWVATGSNAFNVASNSVLNEQVLNGASWPPAATYGDEFIARYGDNDDIRGPNEIVEDDSDVISDAGLSTIGPGFQRSPYRTAAPNNTSGGGVQGVLDDIGDWLENLFRG